LLLLLLLKYDEAISTKPLTANNNGQRRSPANTDDKERDVLPLVQAKI